MGLRQRELNVKRGAFPGPAHHTDLSVLCGHKFLRDGKPQPRAVLMASGDTEKLIENFILVLRIDAFSRIAD